MYDIPTNEWISPDNDDDDEDDEDSEDDEEDSEDDSEDDDEDEDDYYTNYFDKMMKVRCYHFSFLLPNDKMLIIEG